MPSRRAAATHKGRLQAAATKYKARNSPASSADCSTSATKNSTVADGTAAAMPLIANTPSSRAKPPSRSAAGRLARDMAEYDGRAGAGGAASSVHAAQAISSGANTQGSTARPAASSPPSASRPGSAAASSTPSSPKPSRLATTRVRSSGVGATSAPHTA